MERTTTEILDRAVAVKATMNLLSAEQKNMALLAAADALEKATEIILEANAQDIEAAREKISPVMLDRLSLTPARIAGMAKGIREVAALPDPIGKILSRSERPNGLIIEKTAVPIGVIAIIYESRPNVTSDAAALALKSGNVAVLRGGKEAFRSANAIVRVMREALRGTDVPEDAIQLIQDTTRQSSYDLMGAIGKVDLLIPRGGAGLIRACVEHAKVPCIETGTGICHIYVDTAADINKTLDIIENAKTSRPSVCNAEEVCLVHKDIAEMFLPQLKQRLVDERVCQGKIPVELRLDAVAAKVIEGTPANESDFDTEFLDYILAVGIVDGVDDAIAHIAVHSTHHSDAIMTEDAAAADKFMRSVDSAAVYHNASTRFTDGGEFGLGCEMGISTQKMHARGPMGLEELTVYKYKIYGNGQIR